MSTDYLASDRNAAAYAGSPMSFFSIVAPITVVSTVGNCALYGPPILNGSTVVTLPTAVGALRANHRLAIYRLSGGTGAGGTMTAVLFTFNTTRDTTTPVVIARVAKAVDITTTGGWSLDCGAMVTPFNPNPGLPIAIAEPGFGIQIRATAAGSDGTILCEALCRLIPTKVATA